MIKQHKIVFGNRSTYCSSSPGFVFVQSGTPRSAAEAPATSTAGSGGINEVGEDGAGGSLSSFFLGCFVKCSEQCGAESKVGLLGVVSADASFQLLQGERKEAGGELEPDGSHFIPMKPNFCDCL